MPQQRTYRSNYYYPYRPEYRQSFGYLSINNRGMRPRRFATQRQMRSYYDAQYRNRYGIFNHYARLRRPLPAARTVFNRALARRRLLRNRRIAAVQQAWRLRRARLMRLGMMSAAPAA